MKKIIFVLIAVLLVALIGCTQNGNGSDKMDTNNGSIINRDSNVYSNLSVTKTVKVGDKVSVNYTGKFPDGTTFDSSIGRAPLEFVVGEHNVISGFENAVIGMKIGESKTITLPPEQAYGQVDQNKIIYLDKNQFADFNSLTVGMTVYASTLSGIIIEKTDNNAIVDFNPPMAGKTLIFDITLVSIN